MCVHYARTGNHCLLNTAGCGGAGSDSYITAGLNHQPIVISSRAAPNYRSGTDSRLITAGSSVKPAVKLSLSV